MDEATRRAAGRAVRGAAFVLASSYTNMGMGFVATVVLTRLLAPEDFGTVALAAFLFGLLDLRTKLGLDYAFMHRQPTTDELVASHLSLQLSLSVLGLLLAVSVRPLLAAWGYGAEVGHVVLALAGVGALEASGMTARDLLEKDLRFGRSTAVVTGALACSYLISILLAWKGFGYWSLVAGNAANVGLGAAGFWLLAGRRVRLAVSRPMIVWLLKYGAGIFLGSYAAIFVLQFDNFLVGTLVSVATLGYYERAYKIAQWPTGLVTHIVARVSLPFYAQLQDDPARLSRAFGMTLWLIATVALPLALAIFATAPDFVRLLFGENWLPSALYLRFLVVYSVIRPLLDDAGALFVATGHPRKEAAVRVTQAVALILAASPLTLLYGAPGTAIGVGVAFLVGLAVTYRYVVRLIPLPLWQTLRGPALSTVVTLVAVGGLVGFGGLGENWPVWGRVLGQGMLVAGVFTLSMMAWERGEFWGRIGLVWGLLKERP
mgnify:CR=1 FL=1